MTGSSALYLFTLGSRLTKQRPSWTFLFTESEGKNVFRKVSTIQMIYDSVIHSWLARISHMAQCNHEGARMASKGKKLKYLTNITNVHYDLPFWVTKYLVYPPSWMKNMLIFTLREKIPKVHTVIASSSGLYMAVSTLRLCAIVYAYPRGSSLYLENYKQAKHKRQVICFLHNQYEMVEQE